MKPPIDSEARESLLLRLNQAGRQNHDVLNLGAIVPSHQVPGAAIDAAVAAARCGDHRYTPPEGLGSLRQALAQHLEQRGTPVEDVLITAGVSGGIALALLALCDAGDEVLLPDPYFPSYRVLAERFGIVPRLLDTYPSYFLDPDTVRKAVTTRTRAIVLTSPGNPTGRVVPSSAMHWLGALVEEYDLTLVADETYRFFASATDCISPYTASPRRTLLLNGFSKSHAVPGWRIGYAAGQTATIRQMATIQQYLYVCPSSLAQAACLPLVGRDPSDLERYRTNRDVAYAMLRAFCEVERPDAGLSIFPRSPSGDGTTFAFRALSKGVSILPGCLFSQYDTHFRISLTPPTSVLERGIAILKRVAAGD